MDFDHQFNWNEEEEMYRVSPNPSCSSVEPQPRDKSRGGAETGSVNEQSGLHLQPRPDVARREESPTTVLGVL